MLLPFLIVVIGKRVNSIFNSGFARRQRLLDLQQSREAANIATREQFTEVTRFVLGEKTLDWLREQGSINAPTLTSIFAGIESARADEAARFENLIDAQERSNERLSRNELQIEQFQSAAEGRQLTAEGNLFNQSQQNFRADLNAATSADELQARQVIQSERTQAQIDAQDKRAENQREFDRGQQDRRFTESQKDRDFRRSESEKDRTAARQRISAEQSNRFALQNKQQADAVCFGKRTSKR